MLLFLYLKSSIRGSTECLVVVSNREVVIDFSYNIPEDVISQLVKVICYSSLKNFPTKAVTLPMWFSFFFIINRNNSTAKGNWISRGILVN